MILRFPVQELTIIILSNTGIDATWFVDLALTWARLRDAVRDSQIGPPRGPGVHPRIVQKRAG